MLGICLFLVSAAAAETICQMFHAHVFRNIVSGNHVLEFVLREKFITINISILNSLHIKLSKIFNFFNLNVKMCKMS